MSALRQKKTTIFFWAFLFFFLISNALHAEDDPQRVVAEFYRYHLKHSMEFSKKNLNERKKWLSEDLYQLLLVELNQPKSPDLAPALNGDPFTDSQEYPTSFKVIGLRPQTGKDQKLEIELRWSKSNRKKRTIFLHLINVQSAQGSGPTWKIDDVEYEGHQTLRGLLSPPNA